MYDPLIWLKVTSLSSTASVLREGKISLKFQECIQKVIFFKTSKQGDSNQYINDFKNLCGYENFSGLKLSTHDNITDLNDLNSLFGLKKIKSCLHFNYWMISNSRSWNEMSLLFSLMKLHLIYIGILIALQCTVQPQQCDLVKMHVIGQFGR